MLHYAPRGPNPRTRAVSSQRAHIPLALGDTITNGGDMYVYLNAAIPRVQAALSAQTAGNPPANMMHLDPTAPDCRSVSVILGRAAVRWLARPRHRRLNPVECVFTCRQADAMHHSRHILAAEPVVAPQAALAPERLTAAASSQPHGVATVSVGRVAASLRRPVRRSVSRGFFRSRQGGRLAPVSAVLRPNHKTHRRDRRSSRASAICA